MNTRDSLINLGFSPSIFNVMAQRAYVQRNAGSACTYLNNGPFMRDAAIVTAAFGRVVKDEDGSLAQLELPVVDTPYTCILRPCESTVLGIVRNMWIRVRSSTN